MNQNSSLLNEFLISAGLQPLPTPVSAQFDEYLALILRWNIRTNLTAIRDAEGIIKRHFVESIACARALPEGIASVLDFGSGAGFPGIPIALCRPEIAVTLAESQNKKAAFLQEAVRVLGIPAAVYAQRAESLVERFDCVTLRAVDRMEHAVTAGTKLVRPGGWLVLMAGAENCEDLKKSAGPEFAWEKRSLLPLGGANLLLIGKSQAQIVARSTWNNLAR
jgi:16S rRNA (guanine527-N7)-methyltransferase